MSTKVLDSGGGAVLTHERMRQHLSEKINNGDWPVDSKIPSENALARRYRVSRATIRKALRSLEAEGLLRAEQGRGRIVIGRTAAGRSADRATKALGLILTCFGESTWEGVLGIQSVAQERGYSLNLYSTQRPTDDNQSVSRQLSEISRHDIDGLLVYSLQIQEKDVAEFNKHIPTVVVHNRCVVPDIPSFYIGWEWAAYEASRYLSALGYTDQLLLVSGNPFFPELNAELVEGFRYAHRSVDAELSDENIFYAAPDNIEGYESSLEPVLARIRRGGRTAVFSYYNWAAVYLAEYALAHDISVPQELAIMTSEDTKFLNNSPIPITAFDLDKKELTRRAANALIDMLEGGKGGTRGAYSSYVMYGKLVERQSTTGNIVRPRRSSERVPADENTWPWWPEQKGDAR